MSRQPRQKTAAAAAADTEDKVRRTNIVIPGEVAKRIDALRGRGITVNVSKAARDGIEKEVGELEKKFPVAGVSMCCNCAYYQPVDFAAYNGTCRHVGNKNAQTGAPLPVNDADSCLFWEQKASGAK